MTSEKGTEWAGQGACASYREGQLRRSREHVHPTGRAEEGQGALNAAQGGGTMGEAKKK